MTKPSDASERRGFLLHKARSKKTRGPGTGVVDTSRLLEEVASEANLARALLNVVRNKGAPGVDGQTVEEAEAKAPSIIARLHRDLLTGCYRPGDVRRVWLPKPGGGQRGLGIPNVSKRSSKYWNRSTSRTSIPAVTGSALIAGLTPPLRKQQGT